MMDKNIFEFVIYIIHACADKCGLDDHRISAKEKIENIFEYSVLKGSFTKAGL